MRSPTRKTLTAAVVADRYRLERELARGGMGTVWLARDTKLGRQVAIKVMAQELAQSSEAMGRFEREAMAVAQLRSTHVVEVYDYGVQEGLPYIVMELLEGENLGQRLKRVGHIVVDDAVELLDQICKGLKAAHGAGLIHRDLKPSNIFLAHRDDAEVVKLLDFGVVKALDPFNERGGSEETSTGILLGTPQYMSPEQARARKEIDHRSDLWSAAVIAFRMLTGNNPFRGESVGDVVLKICSDELPSIQDYNPALPAVLDQFFAKAFSRDPRQRYQSASALSDAFRGYVQAPPPRASRRSVPDESTDIIVQPPPPRASAPSQPMANTPLPGQQLQAAMPQHAAVAALAGQASGASGLTPAPVPYEATPVSTTVGGTQLAPRRPSYVKNLTAQPLTLVVGGAATLIVGGLIAALWVGSGTRNSTERPRAQTFVPAVQPPPSLFDELGEPPETEMEVDVAQDDEKSGESAPDASSATGPSTPAKPMPAPKSGNPFESSTTNKPTDKPKWF